MPPFEIDKCKYLLEYFYSSLFRSHSQVPLISKKILGHLVYGIWGSSNLFCSLWHSVGHTDVVHLKKKIIHMVQSQKGQTILLTDEAKFQL